MQLQFFTIKKVLSAASTSIFVFEEWGHIALIRSIVFCNSDSVIRTVWFIVKDENDSVAPMGAILFNAELKPNETMQMPDRALNSGDFIIAYSDVADKVSFVADVEIIKIIE